jgi:trk system potassium uptake protein TrkH
MTVISSGGFLPTNSLDRIITTNLQSIFLSLSFLVSLLNFYLIYNIFFNRSDLKNHKEDSYLIILIIIFSTVFYFIHKLDLLSVFVNILSSIGTSGISLGEVQGNFALYLLILTLLGGSVLSTTSGIKFVRIYILIKALFSRNV